MKETDNLYIMKIFILLLIPFFSYAQNESDKYSVDSVIIIQGAKDSLYDKSKLWLTNITSAATSPFQLADKEAGNLVISVRFEFSSDNFGVEKRKVVKYGKVMNNGGAKIKIFVKDNKLKIIVTDILYYGNDFTTADAISSIDNWATQNLNNKDAWDKERAFEYASIVDNLKGYSRKLIDIYAEYMSKKSETDF